MEFQQISIFSFMFQLEANKSAINHYRKCLSMSRKPYKIEYWSARVKEAEEKFKRDFPGYKV